MQRTPMAQLSPLPPLAHRLQHVDSSLSIYRVSRSISLLIPCARFIRQSNRGMCRHCCQRICSFIPCHSPPLKLVPCRIPKLCRECMLAADAGRKRQRAQRVSYRDQSACLRLICCRQNLAPLHVAIVPAPNQTEIIELLLLHGADVDAKDTCAFVTCKPPSQ